jgi:hypothetical protein
MINKIIIVNVYMGPLPFWMPAFLLSCRYNHDIDWLIFCNGDIPANAPPNVRFIPLTVELFNEMASKALGIPVHIRPDFSYKVADFKSAYGVIFEKELCGYSFWGHCDLDIIWGDINRFVTIEMLDNYDVITSRQQRISGHFCLYRNRPEFNTLFLSIPGVEDKLLDNTKYTGVDEDHMTDLLYIQLKPNLVINIKKLLGAFPKTSPRVYWNKVLTTSGAHQRQMLADHKRLLLWKRGHSFDSDGREMLYLHFHRLKPSLQTIDFSFSDDPEQFYIDTTGIHTG